MDEGQPPPALPPPPLPPLTDPWDINDQQNDYYSQVPSNQHNQQASINCLGLICL